ncbi:Crp/Fnr family transcriptional regulator [Bellilinea sp.]|uniref:Crp/Fnr family transcriptional regulator n=1 Tax=Bellilinea sp. TaxID=2838785 RepID=UPI002ADE47AA|nr:Crp/Fnr family transcriptional regulator [Bellilinea sp.]
MPFQPVSRPQDLGLFKNLSPLEVETILYTGRQKKISAEEFFFMQDDPAEAFYVLSQGKVRLSQFTSDGQQILLRIIVPVTPFGAVALAENEHYPVSAQAIEPCTAIVWSKATLDQLLVKYPQLAINAVKILAEHVQEFQQRFTEIATQRVERRLARMILRLANQIGVKTERGVEVNLPLSRQDLAEMVGTTLYTVSRTLSQWETQGLIHSGRERLIILHPHGLVKIADEET